MMFQSNPKGDPTESPIQISPSVQITQSTEKQQSLQTPALKAFGTFATPTASLPDLNSSALSNILRRPFTDMQQVQLRAQIFVYGALIQGTAPDEAYMISAFGGPDGGKGGWEKPWRACVVRAQKLHLATPETPEQRSGRIETPSASHTSSKDSSATNFIIPLSSPLWSLSNSLENLQSSSMQRGSGSAAAHQPLLSPSHAHQTPPVDPTVAALSESDNNEVHAQTCNLMQSLEVTVNAHDRDQVSKSSQILSETVVSESACFVSGGSGSNLAESNYQPGNTPGDNSDVIAHLCHAWKVSCGSSPPDKEDYEEEESDDYDEEPDDSDYLSDDDEYDLLDVEGITMRTPSRSRILQLLPFDSRTQLSEFSNENISPRLARACLGMKRFGFVCETDPIGGNLRISDSKGKTYFYWKTSGPSSEYFTEKETGIILQEAGGSIRNQIDHDLCWDYTVCDLISSCRVIHGLDDKFITLCPRFLCQRVKPEYYERKPRIVNGKAHCCYEYNLLDALRYVKENGIPREDPKDVCFLCTEKREYDPEEDLCQITAIYKYKTLEEALERLKTHTVAAGLACFEGYLDQEIYRGPCRNVPARYLGEHSVVMIEYKELNGGKVVICKGTTGVDYGFKGYIAVSVEVMLTLAGERRKKGEDQTCHIKPQYLLNDFVSVDMDWDQSKKSESEQERHKELNRKFEDSYMDGHESALIPRGSAARTAVEETQGYMKTEAVLPASLTYDIVSGEIQNLGLIHHHLLDYSLNNNIPGASEEKYSLVTKFEVVASALDSEINAQEFVAKSAYVNQKELIDVTGGFQSFSETNKTDVQAHQVGQVNCDNCKLLLMYPHGTPCVRCSSCNSLIETHEGDMPKENDDSDLAKAAQTATISKPKTFKTKEKPTDMEAALDQTAESKGETLPSRSTSQDTTTG